MLNNPLKINPLKNSLLVSLTAVCLTSCTSLSTSMQASQPPLHITVAQDQQVFYQALNSLTVPPKTPQPAPQGVPDGAYKGVMENGEEFTTFVKNGYYDESLVIYYPNLVTQLRTDLVNGLYDGWVTLREPTGLIKQKASFQQGVIQEAIVYNQLDKPEFHFWFNNEQPINGVRYDNNGVAVESMF